MRKYPVYRQLDKMDCGPTCLRMVAKYYGKSFSTGSLKKLTDLSQKGISLLDMNLAARKIGFDAKGVGISFAEVNEGHLYPFIAHWRQNHFVVVYGIRKGKMIIGDPAFGLLKLDQDQFLEQWLQGSEQTDTSAKGMALLLKPTDKFYQQDIRTENRIFNFRFILSYILEYKNLLFHLVLGMLVGTLLQLVFPFLTQAVVDIGIQQKNLPFLYIIFAAQLVLFLSQATVGILRSWILLHVSSRVNISLLSEFLRKLMRLPIRFFDTKMTGDLLQRMNDHQRIESFLTSTTLTTLFSILSFVIFSLVLMYYHVGVFFLFLIGSGLYGIWIWFFLKKRKELDHRNFNVMADNQSSIIQLINGMQEIKLHNSEEVRRWEWEKIQARLFRLNIKKLTLNQTQSTGASFLNELKNLVISFVVAKAVIDGQMTLGMMVAVQYIIGQLNAPVMQLIGFIQSAQDALISLERLKEIHDRKDEYNPNAHLVTQIPERANIHLRGVHFRYHQNDPEPVIKDINLEIPNGKVTAIVGASGSGKTTLLKLLLQYYLPERGEITVADIPLRQISPKAWRDHCGVVMQDGFIFSDTIARNIAVAEEEPDMRRLRYAVRMANINDFIEGLPKGFSTRIGNEGTGLSQGQKQRILIARAVYKDPQLLLFDEATNALDTNTEKAILENLDEFYRGRTVVVVAHRLSTIQNADQIVVVDRGEIRELGNHESLIAQRGAYYALIKNQLEMTR